MPICKTCGESFPNRLEIDGRVRVLSSRKYCLECSPYGKHNTKQLDRLPIGHSGENRKCEGCGRLYVKNRRAGHTRRFCNSCLIKNRIAALKEKALEYKGCSCVHCGYSGYVGALEFHHVDPTTKKFDISGRSIKWERMKPELDKCVVLCSNCHRELHGGLWNF